MTAGAVAIARATPDRLGALAGVLGRAFIAEPMIQWPLHGEGTPASVTAMFHILYEGPITKGIVWEAGEAEGVAVWVPPGEAGEVLDAHEGRDRYGGLVPDGGARYEAMWAWLEGKVPEEPLWYLDAIAVDPPRQRTGVGSALVRHGLALAEDDGVGAFLETSQPTNVGYYERFGFRVTDEGDAPGGGPHVWFMRRDV